MAKDLDLSEMKELESSIQRTKEAIKKYVELKEMASKEIMIIGKELQYQKKQMDKESFEMMLQSDYGIIMREAYYCINIWKRFHDKPKLIEGMSKRMIFSITEEDAEYIEKEHAAGRSPTPADVKAHQKERKITKKIEKEIDEITDTPRSSNDDPEQESEDTEVDQEETDSGSRTLHIIPSTSNKQLDKEALDILFIELEQKILDLSDIVIRLEGKARENLDATIEAGYDEDIKKMYGLMLEQVKKLKLLLPSDSEKKN